MDSETIAIVDTLIQNQGVAESMTGGKVLTKSYDITYHYEVNGKSYQSSDYLDRVTLTIEQRLALKRLQKGDTINIKYPSHNPSKSVLEI